MIEVDVLLHRESFSVAITEKINLGITGIFGRSGAGKTSFLSMLAGLESPDSGIIKIENNTLFDSNTKTNVPIEKRNIGYVFQDNRLFPHLSIEENLKFGVKTTSKIGFDEVVNLLEVSNLLTKKPKHLSGGEQQRIALGRALLSSPEILVLDEPFSAVDYLLREEIIPFIIQIHKRLQIPILVVSHDLNDLLKLTNDLLILEKGKVMGYGKYYNLIQNPKISKLFENRKLTNSFDMYVASTKEALLELKFENGQNSVWVKKSEISMPNFEQKHVKVILNAEDIALSKTFLEEISIQNQLEGIVLDLIEKESSLYCKIDVGAILLCEITHESKKQMNISIGNKIICLFKSVAVKVFS